VRAADLVISKPGYGIVSECIAGGTPILYTSRGDFAEYPILVEGIRKAIPSAYISNEDLLGENLPEKILDILNRDEEEAFDPMRVDGAEVVARRLISF
jgi:UDP-N-acetylglucosamine:LPS N-acetylglucosamine transferase